LICNDPLLVSMDTRISFGIYDSPVVRLEYGTLKTYQKLTGHKSSELGEIVRHLRTLDHVIVQAQFVRGEVDNSTDSEVRGWIKRLRDVEPQEVLISSPPPKKAKGRPQGVTEARLREIAEKVTEEVGTAVTVLEWEGAIA
jgi:hypothetical protein